MDCCSKDLNRRIKKRKNQEKGTMPEVIGCASIVIDELDEWNRQ